MEGSSIKASSSKHTYDMQRPLSDAELLAMIEEFEFETIPDDVQVETDIEDDEDLDTDITSHEINARDFQTDIENRIETVAVETENVIEELEEESDGNIEGAVTAQKKKSKKKVAVNRQWRKTKVSTTLPEYKCSEGVVTEFFELCETPTDVFIKLIEPLLDNLIFQSNLYAVQRHKALNITKEELLTFIGINFIMGYHKLPNWRHYWSTQQDLGVPVVSSAMSRNRFDQILSYIHVNDNSKLDNNIKDKLYKLRPMIDQLNNIFAKVYRGTRALSVDESIILFKGRSSLKQYNPMKPIKRGYKIWSMCDQKGYMMKFEVYQGKNEEVIEKYKDYNLGERVVLSLTEDVRNQFRIICFDNYFTSLALLEKLKTENTLACGTIRPNREGIPPKLIKDKLLNRGQYDYFFSVQDIGIWKWKDNKVVHFASNYHGSEEIVVQRTQKDGTKMDVTAPKVVQDYNAFMGGVDHSDRLRITYGINRRSKKWWHRIFWGLLDIAFVNAYVIYRELKEPTSLLEFRRTVALGLVAQNSSSSQNKRKRISGASATSSPALPKKRRKTQYSVPLDVRHANRGVHWIKYVNNRARCEVCSNNKIQSRPHSICTTCKIHLCCNERKNCFAVFHNME